MATRKEEREVLRRRRIEAEQRERKEQRKWLVLVYGVAGLLGAVVIVGIVVLIIGSSGGSGGGGGSHVNAESGSTNGVPTDGRTGTPPPAVRVTDLKTAARKAGCKLRLGLPDEGHDHLPPGSKTPKYGTDPPTSGAHVEPPYQQADGAYSQMPEEIDFVHSLEHGRMEIQYSPNLSERDQLALNGLYDTLYGGTLLFPNEKMPYEVAATTWTNLIGCKSYKGAITLDAIRDFGKETWGRFGGEGVAGVEEGEPTPVKPAA